jgi:hypothetical protein
MAVPHLCLDGNDMHLGSEAKFCDPQESVHELNLHHIKGQCMAEILVVTGSKSLSFWSEHSVTGPPLVLFFAFPF